MKRKGLGKGLGRGYKNIVPRDPFIHGLSAKGVKYYQVNADVGAIVKARTETDAKNKFSKYIGKTKLIDVTWTPRVEEIDREVSDLFVIDAKKLTKEQIKELEEAYEYEKKAERREEYEIWKEEFQRARGELDAKMSATELEKNLSMFIGTEQYHKLSYMPLLATDGVAYLMKEAESYWLFDAIASYQPKLKNEPFQVWILEKDKTGSGAVLKGYRDYSEKKPKKYKPLVTQKIPYTDFPLKKVKIWVENGVALLPSEH